MGYDIVTIVFNVCDRATVSHCEIHKYFTINIINPLQYLLLYSISLTCQTTA